MIWTDGAITPDISSMRRYEIAGAAASIRHQFLFGLEFDSTKNHTVYCQVTEQDMEDTYQPPFESCIKEGHASCLMCAYNQVNGVPACARGDLLEKARKEWGFDGYILHKSWFCYYASFGFSS